MILKLRNLSQITNALLLSDFCTVDEIHKVIDDVNANVTKVKELIDFIKTEYLVGSVTLLTWTPQTITFEIKDANQVIFWSSIANSEFEIRPAFIKQTARQMTVTFTLKRYPTN